MIRRYYLRRVVPRCGFSPHLPRLVPPEYSFGARTLVCHRYCGLARLGGLLIAPLRGGLLLRPATWLLTACRRPICPLHCFCLACDVFFIRLPGGHAYGFPVLDSPRPSWSVAPLLLPAVIVFHAPLILSPNLINLLLFCCTVMGAS